MTTPTTQSHPTEPDAMSREGRSAGAASSPDDAVATPGAGGQNPGAIAGRRMNIAMFSIGAVTIIGMLVILFGLYVTKPENGVIIFIGVITLLIAVLAWGVVVPIVVGRLIREIFNSRGKERRRPPLQPE